jgi:hypothetical protein
MPASKNATQPETPTTAAVVDNGTQWEMIREESPDKVVFDEIGDQLIGRFVGREMIQPTEENGLDKPFTVLTWRDCLVNGEHMDYVANNAGFALESAFASLPFGVITRVTLIKKTDVGQASKMNDFRVEVAKTSANHQG